MIEMLANFIKNITDFGLEKVCNRYYSIYRAQVTSNADPEHRGRVLLKVPAIFGEKELATFAEPRGFSGASLGKGKFDPPDVDDWVFVEFEMGDPGHPIYSGGWFAENELDEEEFEHVGDVPQSKGYQNKYGHVFKVVETDGKQRVYMSTPTGHFFIIDDSAGEEAIFLIHKTGAQFQIDPKGSVKIVCKDGSFISLDSEQGAVMVTSKDGSSVVLKDDVTIMPKAGNSFLNLGDGVATLSTSGDMIASANSFTVGAGSVVIDGLGARLKLGNAQIAIGAGPTELVDQLIQALTALITTPALCTTGTGPSSGLIPPALPTLIQIIALLTAIKGTLA